MAATDPRLARAVQKLARDISTQGSRLSAIERVSQGRYTSVTLGNTTYYDENGQPVVIVGQQPDGSWTSQDYNGAALPSPSTPALEAGPGTLKITWDGRDFRGDTYSSGSFSHIELHLSTEADFEATDDNEIASFHSRSGGAIVLTLDPVPIYCKFTAVNTSLIESAPSDEVSATPGVALSTDDIDDLLSTKNGLSFNNVTLGDPVPVAQAIGDVWFKPDENHAAYRWDGDSWDPFQFGADAILDSAIQSYHLAVGAVTASAISIGAIVASALADDAVTREKIADGAVDAFRLADQAVEAAKLATGAVTSTKLGIGAVVASALADDAVTRAKIEDGAIDALRLADDAVTSAKIADGAVITDAIANSAINAAKIVDAAITAAKLSANSVTTTAIATDAVTNAKLANDAVDAANLQDSAVIASKLAAAAVQASAIATGAVTSTKLVDGAVLEQKLADNAVSTNKIASSAVDTTKLANSSVTSGKLASNAVTSTAIATGAVTSSKISDFSVPVTKLISKQHLIY